jgi:hypothetical protein
MANQIIFNLYGTLIPLSGKPILRNGFSSFLEKYKDNLFIAHSTKPKQEAEDDLKETGLLKKIKLYGLEDSRKVLTDANIPSGITTTNERAAYLAECVTGVREPESYFALPPFSEISYETRIPFKKTIFIGSSYVGIEEAMLHRVRTVFQIPEFKEESDKFSFDKILIDSLRTKYSSFLRRMNRYYQIEIN